MTLFGFKSKLLFIIPIINSYKLFGGDTLSNIWPKLIHNIGSTQVGSAGIILQAPALYDTRESIDIQLSEIEAATAKPLSEQVATATRPEPSAHRNRSTYLGTGEE
jgi:hypothetical protein